MTKLRLIYVLMLLAPLFAGAQTKQPLVNGEQWLDTAGNPLNAHGAGMLYHDGKYYLYGEYKKGKTILPEWATWE